MREDWVEIPYKNVVDKISTSKQKLKQKEYLTSGKVPIVDQGQELIGGYTNDESKVLDCKLPIIVFGDHTKIVKVINFPFAPGADGTKVLQPKQLLDPKLLAFFTKILVFKIKDKGYARHYQHIEKIDLPIPPFPEQRAIVAKIEQLFSDLDNGIASLKTAQDQLKIYRQAVLKKAFEGELTKEWRALRQAQGTLPSADELLGKIKEERAVHYKKQMDEWELAVKEWEENWKEGKKPGKPKKMKELSPLTEDELDKLPLLPLPWKWVKSGELFEYVTSGSRGWAKYYSDSGAVFLRITNLNFDTLELDLSDGKIQYVQLPPNLEGLRTRIKKGDFLFSITGYLGMFAISPDIEEAYVNQHISLARPYQLNNRAFLGYWIISKSGGRYYLNSKSKGAIKAGLGLDDIISFPIPICSLEEQNQIVQEIESRLSVCDKVEETIKDSLTKAEALRQSILKKAFEGRLLSDAELDACRKEEDWEPAEVLLERIKREKSK